MQLSSRTTLVLGSLVGMLALAPTAYAQEQLVDPAFRPLVESPAYRQGGPSVAIDEAHANFHTADGRYLPFAELLRSDGYEVVPLGVKLGLGVLDGIDVLVIANALPGDLTDPFQSAFTDEECDVLGGWVREGGSLLLIADHAPFGSAAASLAQRFGVEMGKGWVFDRSDSGGITTQLVFAHANGRLGEHPIVRGRTATEEIRTVRTFTGQSLTPPPGAAVLLSLGPQAREAATPDDLNAEGAAATSVGAEPSYGTRSMPVGDRVQGLAMRFGEGRLVVLGEAGFLSAQLVRWPDGTEMRFGMNVPGNDNQQFALNVMHWLSGLLD